MVTAPCGRMHCLDAMHCGHMHCLDASNVWVHCLDAMHCGCLHFGRFGMHETGSSIRHDHWIMIENLWIVERMLQ